MKSKYILGYIYILVVLSISINLFYTFELFGEFFKDNIELNYKETIISALALEISWIVLFIWFILKPYKRKDILILTTIPMIIANLLHNYTVAPMEFLFNILFLGVFISLYFIGYYLLKRYEMKLC